MSASVLTVRQLRIVPGTPSVRPRTAPPSRAPWMPLGRWRKTSAPVTSTRSGAMSSASSSRMAAAGGARCRKQTCVFDVSRPNGWDAAMRSIPLSAYQIDKLGAAR